MSFKVCAPSEIVIIIFIRVAKGGFIFQVFKSSCVVSFFDDGLSGSSFIVSSLGVGVIHCNMEWPSADSFAIAMEHDLLKLAIMFLLFGWLVRGLVSMRCHCFVAFDYF